ncbi:MAG: acyl-CoA dehydrogenase family protein [Acidimicrobiales bacterium]
MADTLTVAASQSIGPVATAATAVAVAESFAPLVREHAAQAEAERRQLEGPARALAAAGLHRVAVPSELGGLGADPITMMRAIEVIAEADGSAGWTLMIGIEVLGIMSTFLPEVAAELLAAQPDLICCGALRPRGKAVPVEGGYVVSGQWPFASGVHNSDFFLGGCVVHDEVRVQPPRTRQVLIPRRDYEIADTWHVAGMRGTGSADVVVRDVFVPEARTTDVLSGAAAAFDHAITRMPIMARLAFNKPPVASGIARAALNDFVELANAKVPLGEERPLAERPRAQRAIAEAEAALEAGRAYVDRVVRELWERAEAGQPIERGLHARVRLACAHSVQASVQAVDTVYGAAGATVNYLASPLERRFRDVHVVPMQITIAPHLIDAAGRVLLGLDPGTPTF